MKESHKRSRNPKYKPEYRLTNWNQYEQSLRDRGNLTLWLSPSAIKSWKSKQSGKQGGQQKYADLAIETVLTLRLLFHLPLRQAEGFVMSLFEMMKLCLPISDHTTLSRRSKTLKPVLKRRDSPENPYISSLTAQAYPSMAKALGRVEKEKKRLEEATHHG